MSDRILRIARTTRQLVVRRPGPQGPAGPAGADGAGSGGLGGVLTSFLMHCPDTSTDHRVTLRLDRGLYFLSADSTPETGEALTSFTMRSIDDESDHLVTLRLIEGVYTLLPDQSPL